ncbi:MAG: SWIM zinc finger domain-containing protein [Acinetobacter sp.]|uniref:SWIM zinc finger family protein n=1 Tax=Acinetobacter sp. TaxID=472 RepID=UPI00258C1219|nr:SWIM zinc finger family protein [Acinetobacter sp.]MCE1272822.1 SWIM zinc finger domain-containing protein [Acinetobacter sp.]
MLLTIQSDQVEQIIPDASSVKSAKKLAKFEAWNNISGSTDQWIWGEIQGSAIYQSAVFLPELKCECSCPSFKRPCKHALALLFVYTEYQDKFTVQSDEQSIPDRVQKWRDKKTKTLEKKENKIDKPIDEEARAKRQLAREKKMDAGIEALQTWLNDVVTMGLGRLRQQQHEKFRDIQSRLVDAQVAGLVSYLDEFSSALYQSNWQMQSSFWLAKLQTAVHLWQNRQQLKPELYEELKQLFGVNLPTDAWDNISAQILHIYALGQVTQELVNTRGRYRRQWLWDSQNLRDYLLLDFEIPPYSNFGLTLPFQKQLALNAKLYPVVSQQRLRLEDNLMSFNDLSLTLVAPKGFENFDQAFTQYANGLKQYPLQLVRFFWLEQLRLVKQDKVIYLVDQDQKMCEIEIKQFVELWFLVGNEPFSAGVEWNGLQLKLVSIWQGGHFECL